MAESYLEPWRHAFRVGLLPLLSDADLECLRSGIMRDDPDLLHGATTVPSPVPCVATWPVEAACAIAYCGWKAHGLETVAEVEEFFAGILYEMDKLLGEPCGCRRWLNYWDTNPRAEVFPAVLAEIELALAERRKGMVPA